MKMNLKTFIETYGDSFPYPVTLVNRDESDQPLIFVNKSFTELSGYEAKEIVGTNCRFLQAGKTLPAINAGVRESIAMRVPFCQDFINYKKTGEVFYNRLVLIPFRVQGVNYILGLQHEIRDTDYKLHNGISPSELADRTLNPLSILLGLEHMGDERFHSEFEGMVQKIKDYILKL